MAWDMSHPDIVAPHRTAFVRLARVRLALVKFAVDRLTSVRLDPEKEVGCMSEMNYESDEIMSD